VLTGARQPFSRTRWLTALDAALRYWRTLVSEELEK